MPDWQVLILCGPSGTGKSSVARHLFQNFPRAVHLQLAPLRGSAGAGLVSFLKGVDPDLAVIEFTGQADQARAEAATAARRYAEAGCVVVVEDTIERPVTLEPYMEALVEIRVQAVTLLPSLEELAARDAMQPIEARLGDRVREVLASMALALGSSTVVLDTSRETVTETVDRILGLPV